MRCRFFINVALLIMTGLAYASGPVRENSYALGKDGSVYLVLERLTGDRVQVLKVFPTEGESREQRTATLPVNELIASVQKDGWKYGQALLDTDFNLWSLQALFANDVVFVQNVDTRHLPSQQLFSLTQKELQLVDVTPHHAQRTAIDEEGRTYTIKGFLKDRRWWLATPYSEGKREFLQAPKSFKMVPTFDESFNRAAEMLIDKDSAWVNAIRDGAYINLQDPTIHRLFLLYLRTQLYSSAGWLGRVREDNSLIRRVGLFLKENNVAPKSRHARVEYRSNKRILRLRGLSLVEAAFRGCLGSDCSTDSRLTRALEPAHLNFAIESGDRQAIGQIEIVLGQDPQNGERLAFFERIQSPKNIRTHELSVLMAGLQQELAKQGIHLVFLKDSEAYVRLAHSVSNYPQLARRLFEALDENFKVTASNRFARLADMYPQKDHLQPVNLVADQLGSQSVYRVMPRLSLLNSINLAVQSAPVVRALNAEEAVSQLTKRLQYLRGSPEAKSEMITDEVWNEVERIFLKPDCRELLEAS